LLLFVAIPIFYGLYTGEDVSSNDLDVIWLSLFFLIIIVRATFNYRKAQAQRPGVIAQK